MKNINWDRVEEVQEFEKVPPGGYICGITAVKDEPEKEYLIIEYDIAEGKFKGYYKQLYDSKGFWGGSFLKSYKEKAQPFFKAFITALEKSNKDFKFNNDETKLKGKFIGLVLAEEEYKANNGEIKKRLYVAQIHSTEKIKNGEFTVPALKRLNVKNTDIFDNFAQSDDEKLPWEE